MKKLLIGLLAMSSLSAFAEVDGLCIAKYKSTSITQGPAIEDVFFKDERAYSAKTKEACLCAISKSINSVQRSQSVEVKKVKVRWMPGKIVGNYATYKRTAAETFNTEDLANSCL
jgi:hypothetical protein